MIAASADPAHGLPPLSNRWAAEAAIYANDLHNATPTAGAVVGRTPQEGFFGRAVSLNSFHRFGTRVWVYRPGHRTKLQPRATPGRFLGFERPFGGGIFRVLLDDGRVTQSQTVEFSDMPGAIPVPIPLPLSQIWRAGEREGKDDDDDTDDDDVPGAPDFAAPPEGGPAGDLSAEVPPVPQCPVVTQTVSPAAPQAALFTTQPDLSSTHWQTQPAGQRFVGSSRNRNPKYCNAERGLCSNVAAALSCRGSSRQKLRESNQLAACPKQEAERVAMTADKCERAGFCGQRKPLQNIRSGEQIGEKTGEQTGEQDAPRRQAPGSGRVQRGRAAQRCVQQRQVECTQVLLEPVAAAVEVTSDATNAGTTEAAEAEAAEAVCWQAADQVEIDAILQLGTWESGGCVLPAGKQALPTHFVRNLKRDGRYKSRLVAVGHKQRPGVDFNETFAPVCSYRTLRMMLEVAEHAGLVLRQFDTKTAFLHGYLKEEVYVRPPRGWEHLAGGSGRVLRLCRALYGLRQAPRAWNQRLEAELTARGFVQSNADPSLWILYSMDGAIHAMFFVDDGMVAARNGVEADALVGGIPSIFEIRRLGEPQDMLGIEISRDLAAGTITIWQCAKAKALAAMFGVKGERRTTPMTPAEQANLRAACEGDTMADIARYQSGVGSLLHLAQCVRPDIAVPVGALAA
jgi:hypothetical protein